MIIILVKLVMNIFFEVKIRTNDASAYTYSTNRSNQNFILNETKNIKHQPLVFFFL
jgi:hypothetical protein